LLTTLATKSTPFFNITLPPLRVVSELPIVSFHLVVPTAAVPVGDVSKVSCPAFNYISDSLTDTEAANLYTRVQAYQTALSRNV